MIRLTKSLAAWGTPHFERLLKDELEQLKADALPLQQGLSGSSAVADKGHSVLLLASGEEENYLKVRVGLFYYGVVAGCSCADDPTPVDIQNEYCEAVLMIDKTTAQTSVTLL